VKLPFRLFYVKGSIQTFNNFYYNLPLAFVRCNDSSRLCLKFDHDVTGSTILVIPKWTTSPYMAKMIGVTRGSKHDQADGQQNHFALTVSFFILSIHHLAFIERRASAHTPSHYYHWTPRTWTTMRRACNTYAVSSLDSGLGWMVPPCSLSLRYPHCQRVSKVSGV